MKWHWDQEGIRVKDIELFVQGQPFEIFLYQNQQRFV